MTPGDFMKFLGLCGYPQSGTNLPAIVVQKAPTYASLPASPAGLFLVLADETKGGTPTIYLFDSGNRYWVAMVQDA